MLILFILLMCGVCHANTVDTVEDAKSRASIAAATDILTTTVALSQGGYDLNPIIGTNQAMLIPMTIFKFYIINRVATSDDPDHVKKNNLNFITSLWGGAVINNFLVLVGVTSPASLMIGAVSGYMIYDKLSEKVDK